MNNSTAAQEEVSIPFVLEFFISMLVSRVVIDEYAGKQENVCCVFVYACCIHDFPASF